MSNEKVDHVKAAIRSLQTKGHTCHWPGCGRSVVPAAWGCKKHWFMLPPEIRRRIWRAYRPGQEVSKTPSTEYIEAAREADAWITENHPPQEMLL